MPPEYVESGFVSKKFDVFSLGVVIIKMMAGNMGYFRCAEKSPKDFIEHVGKNQLPVFQNWCCAFSSNYLFIS